MQVTRATIFPLLAPAEPSGRADATVTDEFCVDLSVVYCFGPAYGQRLVTHDDLRQLDLSHRALRRTALDELERLADRAQFHGRPPALMLSFDGLESSLLLSERFWARMSDVVPGEIVVGVPARDVVIVTGSDSSPGLEKARRAVDRVLFAGDEHPLTQHLLVRRGGAWQPFEAAPAQQPVPPARRQPHGPDQPPRQYQDHPSWPEQRVPISAMPVSGTPSRRQPVPVLPAAAHGDPARQDPRSASSIAGGPTGSFPLPPVGPLSRSTSSGASSSSAAVPSGPGFPGPGSSGPGFPGPGSSGPGFPGPGSSGPGFPGPASSGPASAGRPRPAVSQVPADVPLSSGPPRPATSPVPTAGPAPDARSRSGFAAPVPGPAAGQRGGPAAPRPDAQRPGSQIGQSSAAAALGGRRRAAPEPSYVRPYSAPPGASSYTDQLPAVTRTPASHREPPRALISSLPEPRTPAYPVSGTPASGIPASGLPASDAFGRPPTRRRSLPRDASAEYQVVKPPYGRDPSYPVSAPTGSMGRPEPEPYGRRADAPGRSGYPDRGYPDNRAPAQPGGARVPDVPAPRQPYPADPRPADPRAAEPTWSRGPQQDPPSHGRTRGERSSQERSAPSYPSSWGQTPPEPAVPPGRPAWDSRTGARGRFAR